MFQGVIEMYNVLLKPVGCGSGLVKCKISLNNLEGVVFRGYVKCYMSFHNQPPLNVQWPNFNGNTVAQMPNLWTKGQGKFCLACNFFVSKDTEKLLTP